MSMRGEALTALLVEGATQVPVIEKLLRRLLTEDIEFNVLLAHPDVVIIADITQIDQVLMNLATNAMSRGGKLVVGAEEIVLDSQFARVHGLSELRATHLSR